MEHVRTVEVDAELRAGGYVAEGVVLGFANGRVERWVHERCERVGASSMSLGAVIALRVAARRVAVLYDQRLVVRDLASLEEVANWSLDRVLDGALAKPNRLWDRARPLALALSPDGRRALIGTTTSPSHHLIDLATGEVLFAGAFDEFEEACGAAAFSPDGRTFAAGAFADGDYYVDVNIYRCSDFERLAIAAYHCLHVADLAYSPDSRQLARASREYNLSGNGEAIVCLEVPDEPVDPTRLYKQRPVDDRLGYDADAGRPFWGHEVDDMYLGVRYVADGRIVALCGDGRVRLFGKREEAALSVSSGAFALDGDGVHFAVFSPRRVDWIVVQGER